MPILDALKLKRKHPKKSEIGIVSRKITHSGPNRAAKRQTARWDAGTIHRAKLRRIRDARIADKMAMRERVERDHDRAHRRATKRKSLVSRV